MAHAAPALAVLCLLSLLGACSMPGTPPAARNASTATMTADTGAATIIREDVLHGTGGNAPACEGKGRVRVTVTGRDECLRYYAAGLDRGTNRLAVVFLHGDMQEWHGDDAGLALTHRVTAHGGVGAHVLQAAARRWAIALGHPYILLARPGTFGSTGDHRLRRSRREVALIDAALDQIKARHGIARLVVAGTSGGGHLAAALLSRRDDISCAVITSGVVAVKMRARLRGWPAGAITRADTIDPIDEVASLARHARRPGGRASSSSATRRTATPPSPPSAPITAPCAAMVSMPISPSPTVWAPMTMN